MPKFWPLSRKKKRFAPVPVPGPHPKRESLPLVVVIKDIFKLCRSGKEAKKIIKNKEMLIDGREIIEEKFPVGLMDILTTKKKKENFLVLPAKKGFEFKKVSEKNAESKYCKIIGKRMLKKGMQLNLHDGRNIILPKKEKDKYKLCDTLKISLKNKKTLVPKDGASFVKQTNVEKVIPYKEGEEVLITGGKNRGIKGKIKEIVVKKDLQGQRVKVEINKEDKIFKRGLVFVVPEGF